MTLGVRGIVVDAAGQVALVRHTYVAGWHLPGGGVERGEPAHFALQRELAEEAGVALARPARLFGVYSNERWFRGDHILVYVARHWRPCKTDHEGEIEAVHWFAPQDLPADATPATQRRLAEFLEIRAVSEEW
jgi:ADP-ribose pyrophosphatase YjhB (NUDIX family)